ncbi:hypothetical protein LJC31_06940 [Synergistaceae bacterium OttesenSCG-928-I11]|nr:hypothetical protein [Synergistaceae bacterium OttesenSCG-928-I11]
MNATKKKFCIILLLALALLVPLAAAAAPKNAEAQKFFERRLIRVWFEGMAIDELVLGARGKITLLYVDAKMGAAIQKLGSSASDEMPADTARHLLSYTGNYGKKKGHTLFTASVEAFKHWSFDPAELTVGGYRPTDGDLVTGVIGDRRYEISPGINELPSGYAGMFSFYVPNDHLKAGTEIEVGYGEHTTTWKVPSKNE